MWPIWARNCGKFGLKFMANMGLESLVEIVANIGQKIVANMGLETGVSSGVGIAVG